MRIKSEAVHRTDADVGDIDSIAEAACFSKVGTAARPDHGSPQFDEIQAVLLAWWKSILKRQDLGENDDLLNSTGYPLAGAQILRKIGLRYHVHLQLADLFHSRSVRSLASLILEMIGRSGKDSRVWSCTVGIQPMGSRVPIVAIQPVDGTVHVYESLARALGPDQPLFGLQSPLLFRADGSETSIEELTTLYIQELKDLLPSGPYLLIGASFGGFVAFEMARKLAEEGKAPPLLLLIDSVVPGSSTRVEMKDRASSIWDNLRNEGAPYVARKLRVKLNHISENAMWQFQDLLCKLYRHAGRNLPFSLRWFHVEATQRRAMDRHVFKPYSGNVQLARAIYRDDILGKRDDEKLGWEPLVSGKLDVYDIPVNHISMLDWPAVQEFAGLVKSLLPE